jgi:molybdopterin biosynthesis enzyme
MFCACRAAARTGGGARYQAGKLALSAGQHLHAGIALAAALGRTSLPVFQRLSVGLFSTGDEVRVGILLQAGQIWDANRWMLRNLLEVWAAASAVSAYSGRCRRRWSGPWAAAHAVIC